MIFCAAISRFGTLTGVDYSEEVEEQTLWFKLVDWWELSLEKSTIYLTYSSNHSKLCTTNIPYWDD